VEEKMNATLVAQYTNNTDVWGTLARRCLATIQRIEINDFSLFGFPSFYAL
jgi:hypothetical protein